MEVQLEFYHLFKNSLWSAGSQFCSGGTCVLCPPLTRGNWGVGSALPSNIVLVVPSLVRTSVCLFVKELASVGSNLNEYGKESSLIRSRSMMCPRMSPSGERRRRGSFPSPIQLEETVISPQKSMSWRKPSSVL